MVNRVLIRLKVVQMLYGYLLSRSEFKIETPVESSSRDRRYSFQAYAELLLLMLEMSGYKIVRDRVVPASVASAVAGARYADSRTARFLMGNDEVRGLISANAARMPAFDSAVPELAARLKVSSFYRELAKVKNPEVADEIAFWTGVLRTTVIKTPAVVEAMRTNPDFTIRGMEMGAKMLCETLSNYSDTRNVLADTRKDLKVSLDKSYELYHALLWLPVELTRAQEQRIDAAREKYLPTAEDLNPDMRFVENKFVAAIAFNPEMEAYRKDRPVTWTDDPLLIQRLLDLVTDSEIYKDYIAAPGEKSMAEDCELWRALLKNVIVPSDDLSEDLESKSIFWNDDLEVMSSFALKTIKNFARDGQNAHLLSQYKDDEDAAFGAGLFGFAVEHREDYRELIDEFVNTKKWDVERLAMMDIVIMLTALAEIMNYPSIPLSVSANEYVEIANRYSNPRSGSFINGMIEAITDKLRADGLLHKSWA